MFGALKTVLYFIIENRNTINIKQFKCVHICTIVCTGISAD